MARVCSLHELRGYASRLHSQGAPVAFLFGAGLSYYSGSPLFGELMDSCISALHQNDKILRRMVDRLQGGPGYSRIAPEALFNLLFEAMGGTGLEPVRVFALGKATYPHYCAVQSAQLLDSQILTTNFDLLIEDAAERLALPSRAVHLHGRVDRPKSIRIMMNSVWSGNLPKIRHVTDAVLLDRHVFVGGYRGLDSDVFPSLSGAKELIWLKRPSPAGGLFDENPDLARYSSKLTFCVADIQDFLEAILLGLGGVPAVRKTPARQVLDWRTFIDAWGAALSKEDSYAVIGKLLALAGDADGACECYELLYTGATSLSERGIALAGLVSALGPRKADWPSVERYAAEYDAIALRRPVRERVFGPSVVLNARETAHLSGTQYPFRHHWRSMLALQAGSPRRRLSRIGWLLNQSARGWIECGRFARAQAAMFGASIAFRLTSDFSGTLVLSWNEQELRKIRGLYGRKKRLDNLLGSPDMRFVDDLFLFWIHWQESEHYRLQGRFKDALSAIERIDPSVLHPVHRIHRNLEILASTRGNGTQTPDDAAAILGEIDADCSKLASVGPRLSTRILFERVLTDAGGIASGSQFRSQMEELSRRTEALQDRPSADLLCLLRLSVLGDRLSDKEMRSLVESPIRIVRVHALLAIGSEALGKRAYERVRAKELRHCTLHHMVIERDLLLRGTAPGAVAIQVPH